MAPIKTQLLVLAATGAVASAYVAPQVKSYTARPPTKLYENFGIDFAEDSYANTEDVLLGEANYKQFVQRIDDNSFLNRQYNVLRRVREKDLLKATADAGILSKLEKNGLDLATLESLLPTIEKLGLLSLVANNQQLLVNGIAPILVEPAPLLLPVVAGALEAGPPAFFLAAAVSAGLEGYLLANDVEVPFIGLPAGVVLGLLLVPLTAVFAGVGVTLSGLKK